MKKKTNYELNCKKSYKKIDLRISFLNFDFVIIYIIHKILVLIKNHMNYSKDNISVFSFKKYNKPLFFQKIIFFHNT